MWNLDSNCRRHIKSNINTIISDLKIQTSTPLESIHMETGELPVILECEKRQLTYLCVLLNSENQIKDILARHPTTRTQI